MREYKVEIGGLEHTLLYSDEDAERLGLKPAKAAEQKQAPAPKNKARSAPTKKA